MRSKRMKKGQIAEGNVTTVEFPNKGIVMTDEGERVIVKNTIPGQRVSFAVNKVRKGKAEGRLLETVKKSPRETADTCRHFGQCGGCTYQSLPYEEQLKIKETQVRGMIEQAIGDACAYEFLPIRHSPRVLAYRNKMEFSFGDEYKDGPLALGMHKRGSFYDIVTVEDCRIVDGDFRAILMATLAYFREQEISFYHRLRHTGYLRHLLVRKAVKTGEILVDLITTTQDWRNVQEQEPDERAKIEAALLEKQGRCPHAGTVNEEKEKQLLAGWKDVLLALSLEGTLKGVLHTKNDSVADVVKNEGTEVLFGQDYFYEEESGIPMKGLNRLLLAFRDMEYRYLFSGNINGDSLYLETRNVMDRAARIAPFLSYDNDPYLVITDEGRLVYMLDAYTHTNRYPYSQAYNDSGLNYLRNSVKVTVDAYNGEVNFYIFDEKDPIAATYAGIYPSLFKSREEMPGDLRRHVRYPEAMFEIQSLMLQDYHMSNPVVFYNREDRWSFADQIIGAERAAQEPYYTISRLPGETEEEFVMLRNFTPYGRDNMVAWLAGRSDGDNYGKLLLYTFSKGSQIPGPMQVESQIDQDAEISSQLSLWGQSGSDLIRGNMLVYPVDDSLLYVEPLYLSSDKNKYPQLLRIFVYYGDKIVMAESLSEALWPPW